MCKRAFSILLVFVLVFAEVAVAQTSAKLRTVRIPKNTVLRFALVTPLNSATAKVGDEVPLRLTRALVVDGVTILPVGHVVQARVKAERPAKKCDSGYLELELARVRFSDASSVKTKVFYTSYFSDALVPESWEENGNRFGRAIVSAYLHVVFFPEILAEILQTLRKRDISGCPVGEEQELPAESTIGVVILRKHKVRV
jgi:hypothetical protein